MFVSETFIDGYIKLGHIFVCCLFHAHTFLSELKTKSLIILWSLDEIRHNLMLSHIVSHHSEHHKCRISSSCWQVDPTTINSCDLKPIKVLVTSSDHYHHQQCPILSRLSTFVVDATFTDRSRSSLIYGDIAAINHITASL